MIRRFMLVVFIAALAGCNLELAGPGPSLDGLPEGLDVVFTVDPGAVVQHAPFSARLDVTNTTTATIEVVTAHGCLAIFASILETVGNTPVVRINQARRPRRRPLRQGRGVQPARLREGPPRARRDRGGRGVGVNGAEAGPDRHRGDERQHRHRPRDGVRAKGYPLVVTMAETFSVERRRLMRFLGAKVVSRPPRARGRHGQEGRRARRDARLVPDAAVRERGERRHPLAHDRARDHRDFDGERLDYWVTGFGTGGTLKGVARVLEEGAAGDEDRGVRAGQDAQLLERHVAAAQPRRLAGIARIRPGSRTPSRAGRPDFIPKLTGDAVDGCTASSRSGGPQCRRGSSSRPPSFAAALQVCQPRALHAARARVSGT
jgi:cysteine synthase